MSKTTHFFGQSVFGQLISLIDSNIISKATKICQSDRYVKKFKTKDHLISMLFCSFAKVDYKIPVCITQFGQRITSFTVFNDVKYLKYSKIGNKNHIFVTFKYCQIHL